MHSTTSDVSSQSPPNTGDNEDMSTIDALLSAFPGKKTHIRKLESLGSSAYMIKVFLDQESKLTAAASSI
eukprot:4734299-Ditylum_brightwellii.AAC.1